MRCDNFPVTQEAIRPIGEADKCYLCERSLGEEHKTGCVFRERTILVEFKCNLVVSVPEHWDFGMIDFHFNESSYCRSNLLEELQALDERATCLCRFSEVAFIREATEQDEIDYCVSVASKEVEKI